MAGIVDTLSNLLFTDQPGRELSTTAWVTFIKNATGQDPLVRRDGNINRIEWAPGQARKMTDFFDRQLKSKKQVTRGPSQAGGLGFSNVKIDWGKVFVPLAVRKLWLPVTIYTVIVVAITANRHKLGF